MLGLAAWLAWPREQPAEPVAGVERDGAAVDRRPGRGPIAPRDRARRSDATTSAANPRESDATPSPAPDASLVVRVRLAESAVAGATVAVEPGSHTATTDAAGEARFEGLEPGAVTVTARSAGHVRAVESAEISTGATVTIALWIQPGIELSGRVLDAPTGDPIAGARVEAHEGGELGGRFVTTVAPALASATTREDGWFRLDGLPRGELTTISASARGHAPASVVVQRKEAAREALDLRLERAGTVQGIVVNRDGGPVAGARVFVFVAGESALLEDPETTTRSSDGVAATLRATSDASGRFEVSGVTFGDEYVAIADAEGFARSEPLSGIRTEAAAPVAETTLVLRRPGALAVRVIGPGAQPVPGASVELRLHRREWTLTTGAGGVAELSPADLGPYVVTVRAPGLPMRVRAYQVEEGATKSVEIVLPEAYSISGVLVDDAGTPLVGRGVHAFRPTWEDRFQGMEQSEGRTVSGEGGRFRIDGLLAGGHDVWAQDEGRAVTGKLQDVEAPAEGVQLVSVRRATLRFRVTAPAGTAPPAQVQVRGQSRSHTRDVDVNDSEPLLVEGLAPGTFTFSFHAAGLVGLQRSFVLRVGETTDLGDLLFDAGHEVRGRVVDSAGVPVADAEVAAGEVFTLEHQVVTTDSAGTFTLRALASGPNTVRVRGEGFLTSSVDVEAGPGAAPAVVRIRRGGLLRGTVRRADGTLVVGARVEAHDQDWKAHRDDMDDRLAHVRTDPSGAFAARLLPGRYAVKAHHPETGMAADAVADLTEGGETVLDLVLETR